MQSTKPSDYPQFAFRISPFEKESLLEQIEKLQEKANRKRSRGTKVVKKNDIIILALQLGLKELERNVTELLRE